MPISGSSPVFSYFEAIDIRLDGGETQVLEAGLYTVKHCDDAYANLNLAFNPNFGHIELYIGAAWRDYLIDLNPDEGLATFWADGVITRFANGAAPGTFYRLIGVRRY